MMSAKLIVAYPQPKDVDDFEEVYQKGHVPMAIANLAGKTKIVATKVVPSPQGNAIELRIALRRRHYLRGHDLGLAGQVGDRHGNMPFLVHFFEIVDVLGLGIRNNQFCTHHMDSIIDSLARAIEL